MSNSKSLAQNREAEIAKIKKDWAENPRWNGIKRGYTAEDVYRLRGSLQIEHTLARHGAEKLWKMMNEGPFVNTLGASTGNQAMQQVKAGLKAIYLSGWQVAADANDSMSMYPDQSLYAVSSVPSVVRRINNALTRADQIQHVEGQAGKAGDIDFFAPIVADAEAGFGGVLNAYELMKAMIEAGAAGVHFEDQLSSAKKCGHMGGKVLVPTQEAVQKLVAARLAADVCGVPTIVLARTDAEAANLLTSDVDEYDRPFITYNCSPSFNWKRSLDDASIAKFQRELGAMGYKFQFITLAGFHSLNYSMFELAHGYARNNMSAFVELQEKEFAAAARGFTAVKHQREVGAGYFDEVTQVVQGGNSSVTALHGSTEDEQFFDDSKKVAKAA